MSDFNQLNKGNKRKEAVGRNAKFVLLLIYEKLECNKEVHSQAFHRLRFLFQSRILSKRLQCLVTC